MVKSKVTVVLVNWNGVEIISAALDSLKVQTFKNFEIIVVDNSSQDDSINFIAKNYPDVHVIAESKNHGFTEAVNIPIGKVFDGRYFMYH